MLPHSTFTSIALLPFAHFSHYPFPSFPFTIFLSLPLSHLPLTSLSSPSSPSISIALLFLCPSFPTAISLTTYLPPPTTDFSPHLPPWLIFPLTTHIPSLIPPHFSLTAHIPSLSIFSYFPYSPTVHTSHCPSVHFPYSYSMYFPPHSFC